MDKKDNYYYKLLIAIALKLWKTNTVILVVAITITFIGISFLLTWPVTIFFNYMITLFGGVGVLKVWHVWTTITIINILVGKWRR